MQEFKRNMEIVVLNPLRLFLTYCYDYCILIIVFTATAVREGMQGAEKAGYAVPARNG